MISGFAATRIAVVGDLMLDVYIDGSVARVSPEAPIPVLLQERARFVAGGAANVAANIAALGGRCRVVGLVGADEPAMQLRNALQAHGEIETTGLVTDGDRHTTTKTRIMCGWHQIVRLDRESVVAPPLAVAAALSRALAEAVAWADIVVVSDYAKGVCLPPVLSEIFERARSLARPVIVDPKRRDIKAYSGATILTPNRRELTEATGLPCDSDAEAEVAARAAIAQTGADVLLKRSEQGMSYFAEGLRPVHLPTYSRDVFDVSGAGDTVVAVLALGLGAGLPIEQVMRVANHAAGIVVGKVGTSVVSQTELAASLDTAAHAVGHEGGRLSLTQAVRARETWRQAGLKVGLTNGCFDLLHPGHISLLEQAAGQCDRLIVALNSDASVRRLKGAARPLQNEQARARVIGALAGIDAVVVFDEDTPFEIIKALRPDVLVKGADYAADAVVGGDIVKAAGGRVMLADLVAGQSSSRLIQRLDAASPDHSG